MSDIRRIRSVLLPLLLVLAPACRRDEGPARLAHAQESYRALVDQGVPPSDPRWEGIIAEFESVPRDSKVWPEAQARLEALRQLHGTQLPRRPLSRPGEPDGGSPSLDEHGHPM